MNREEITHLFDQQAPHYDENWKNVSPIKDALHLMLLSYFSQLPRDARVLCVGAGTGQEVIYLAEAFPDFSFTVVEPAPAMIRICEQQMAKQGYESRCYFHQGFLETLPDLPLHDAATCLLVSHFLTDEQERIGLFTEIAKNLKAGGRLFNADLSTDRQCPEYANLLDMWLAVLVKTGMNDEQKQNIIATYDEDVALLPPDRVVQLIKQGGFDSATGWFQAGLIQAQIATCATGKGTHIKDCSAHPTIL